MIQNPSKLTPLAALMRSLEEFKLRAPQDSQITIPTRQAAYTYLSQAQETRGLPNQMTWIRVRLRNYGRITKQYGYGSGTAALQKIHQAMNYALAATPNLMFRYEVHSLSLFVEGALEQNIALLDQLRIGTLQLSMSSNDGAQVELDVGLQALTWNTEQQMLSQFLGHFEDQQQILARD